MNLTLAEGLHTPPLNRCRVLAGETGLHRPLTSVNIMDAPDTAPWLKRGELLLTTGYVIKDDPEAQVRLIRDLCERGCAGLAIKTRRFLSEIPAPMLREADALGLPILEIPYDLALSDLLLPLLGEILTRQSQASEQARRTAFLASLFRGELHSQTAILAQGQAYGLLPGCEYICLAVILGPDQGGEPAPAVRAAVGRLLGAGGAPAGASLLFAELDDMAVLLQARGRKEAAEEAPQLARRVAEWLADRCAQRFPELEVTVGIGNRRADLLGISASYREAQEAARLGRRVLPAGARAVYEYAALEPHALLQHLPGEIREGYFARTLGVLAQHDQKHGTEFLRTLEVYLARSGRLAEVAQRLYVHRNTVKFRIARIEELLGVDLGDGETAFRLQLALRLAHLRGLPGKPPGA